jgi:hypothetical protein
MAGFGTKPLVPNKNTITNQSLTAVFYAFNLHSAKKVNPCHIVKIIASIPLHLLRLQTT